jgi:hypothetical protein
MRDPRAPGEDPRQYLRDCEAMFFDLLCDSVHASVNGTNDLFDSMVNVPAHEVAAFRAGRSRWVEGFEKALRDGYNARIAGRGRHERRPDVEGSQSGLQLMDPAEQDTHLSLVESIRRLRRVTRLEVSALDPRIALVLGERGRPVLENPFGPSYVMDAIGGPARALYASPYTWRALMARVVSDVTPVLYRIYVAQNRFLADRDVLPDIKAWLRSRSPYRPSADREIVATFRRLQSVARTRGGIARPIKGSDLALAPDVRRSEWSGQAAPAPSPRAAPTAVAPPASQDADAAAASVSDADIRSALAALLARTSNASPRPSTPVRPSDDPDGLPAVDANVASRAATGAAEDSVVDRIVQFAQSDVRYAIVSELASRGGQAPELSAIPQNLIPHFRAMLAAAAAPPEVLAATDLVAQVVDYVFRDPLLPAELHSVFERLQLPILRIALFDDAFFADVDHPARRLLNILAEAAIGATEDAPYLARLLAVAGDVAQKTCTARILDHASTAEIASVLRDFVADERRRTTQAIAPDVASAIAAERRDLARSQAVQMVRNRLAGLDPPPRIRKFAETIWVDYLAAIIRHGDPDGSLVASALRTLDDLLWSVSAKERPDDRKRLRERVPTLIGELRRGAADANAPAERVDVFMNELLQYHVEDMKAERAPAAAARLAAPARKVVPDDDNLAGTGDFVMELILGTWVRFHSGGRSTLMRLRWASVMREHYVFAGRGPGRGRVLTPEDLVRELGNGGAAIVVEPIPLVERAIDAAFDAIGGGAARTTRPADAGGTTPRTA